MASLAECICTSRDQEEEIKTQNFAVRSNVSSSYGDDQHFLALSTAILLLHCLLAAATAALPALIYVRNTYTMYTHLVSATIEQHSAPLLMVRAKREEKRNMK
jgi:hypothetical protein